MNKNSSFAMNKDVSVYLDLVRFMAAMAVFIDHVSGRRFTGGLFWQVGPYGPEAVDIFFVLSGFVIAYVYDTRENTVRSYAVSRFARIYSVAIPALLATFILDAIGRAAKPQIYTATWGYVWHGRISQIIHALTFTNEIWFNNSTPGSNLPFWSLGYEVWYYVIFAVFVFSTKSWRIPLVILMLIFVGPHIASKLPIWLLGVGAYSLCKRTFIPVPAAACLCFGAIIVWIGYEVYAWNMGRPIGSWLLLQDYIIGILFTVHLIGFRFISHIFRPILQFFSGSIRWIAGTTLTLYLFHLPLSQFFAAESLWGPSAWQTRVLIYGCVPILIVLIAEVTERRKNIWRRGFEAIFRQIEYSRAR